MIHDWRHIVRVANIDITPIKPEPEPPIDDLIQRATESGLANDLGVAAIKAEELARELTASQDDKTMCELSELYDRDEAYARRLLV